MRTFVIADIHGQYDKLLKVLDLAGFDPSVDRLIGLGDYIDYGPDSVKVLEWLCERRHVKRHVFLAGNHENFIYAMAVHSKAGYLDTWLQNGGEATLKDYDWDPGVIRWIGENPGEAARRWYKDDSRERSCHLDQSGIASFVKDVFPEKHLGFILGLRDQYRKDEYVFSHNDLNESERKGLINIYAHYHEGLKVTFQRMNIAARHGEVGCLLLDDLSWYSSDGDYLQVDRERLWSRGSRKGFDDAPKGRAPGD